MTLLAARSLAAAFLATWVAAGGRDAAGSALVTFVPAGIEGTPSPDGNGALGNYLTFTEPCINQAGQVCFAVALAGTAGGNADNEILLRADPGAGLVVLAREGQPIPVGPGTFLAVRNSSRQYVMNDLGVAAFHAVLTGTAGGSTDDTGLFTSLGPGTVAQLARKGTTPPGAASAYATFGKPSVNDLSPPAVAFYANLGTSTSFSSVSLARGSSLHLLSVRGVPAPDGNGTFNTYSGNQPAVHPGAEEAAFSAQLTGTAGGGNDNGGCFRAGPSYQEQIVRGWQLAPIGAAYNDPGTTVYNSNRNAAFSSSLVVGGSALFQAGDGSDLGIAATGYPAPEGNGNFSTFFVFLPPAISESDAVAFKGFLTATPLAPNDDTGIYLSQGAALTMVARENDVVPEGNGRFSAFGDVVAVNAQGHVLFSATLRQTPGGTSDDRGLYLWGPVGGVQKLAREGDTVNGRTVLQIFALSDTDFGGFRSLNDADQAVVRLDLSGSGADGIYVIHVVMPTAVGPPVARSDSWLSLGPNPMAGGAVTARWELPRAAPRLKATVTDLGGRLVRTLHDGPAAAAGAVTWDGRDAAGRAAPAGVYYLVAETSQGRAARRLVRLR